MWGHLNWVVRFNSLKDSGLDSHFGLRMRGLGLRMRGLGLGLRLGLVHRLRLEDSDSDLDSETSGVNETTTLHLC